MSNAFFLPTKNNIYYYVATYYQNYDNVLRNKTVSLFALLLCDVCTVSIIYLTGNEYIFKM